MTAKSGIKLNGLLVTAIYGKTAAGKVPKPRKKRTASRKMETDPEHKAVDDVDIESKPVPSDSKENNRLLSPVQMSTDDTLSISQMPNVVNHNLEKSNGSIHEGESAQMLEFNDCVSDKSQFQGLDKTASDSARSSAKSIAKQLKAKIKINQENSLQPGIGTLNQDVARVRKDSLSVPAASLETPAPDGAGGPRRDSNASGLSFGSQVSPRSNDPRVDYIMVPVQPEEKKSVFSQEDSWIRVAIPYLPLWVAVVCLILNVLFPGAGTIVSGFSILCCGTSRVPHKYEQDMFLIICVNTWVGVAQLFTVTFLFVGWFWSLAWGIKMVILSVERRRELEEQRARELQTKALDAFNMALQRQTRF